MTVSELGKKIERLKGQKLQLEKNISNCKQSESENTKLLHQHEQAKEIIRAVTIMTQEKLQYKISDIVSLASEAVFDDPYELGIEFIPRRNKTECDLYFIRDGSKLTNPLNESGVGAADVISFALRIALYVMSKPRSHPVIILDEPFKHLKGKEENMRVLKMVKEISSKLNLQIIMVSDERILREDIIESADRTFEVIKYKGKSKVKMLK